MRMCLYPFPMPLLLYPSPIPAPNEQPSVVKIEKNACMYRIVICREKLLILGLYLCYFWFSCNEPEQKARVSYDNILRLSDDPDVNDVIKFLREREIVHFQRFGEAMQLLREKLNQKNVYYRNPAFDM